MSAFLEEKQMSLAAAPHYSTTVTEKPFHYTYLKDFRVEQCQLFLQHKCTQHRPFTCFNWHFMNQRRRRPRKKKDGTFNYSPDVYCGVYDENTGLCPNGDDCQYLHRTAGDTERRYHLRYYKTSTCVYETDSRGFCVKNGPHCAFAHGPHDLRPPVYDVRELQGLNEDDDKGSLVGSLERDKGVLLEDPRWQDHSFVLTYYKTEPCKRPPRLCRQGYACPYYHNAKDRRRGPKGFNYRSTPCPSVKLNDEWSDPAHCDRGDSCPYCHTRTEQQFHPEIYKSTKCNDIQQTGYCPRGPFCAFAHNDGELTESRTLTTEPMISTNSPAGMSSVGSIETDPLLSTSPVTTSYYGKPSQPQPISSAQKLHYQENISSSSSPFQRAPGAEFNKSYSLEDQEEGQSYLMRQFEDIDNDCSLDEAERQRRKHNLMKLVKMPPTTTPSFRPSSLPSCVTGTLEAMVGPNLDDLTLDDIDSSGLEAITPEEPLPGSADMVGQSPIAQGFMQSFMSHSSSSSIPYSTPLGPLSPFTITTNQSDTTGSMLFSEVTTGIEPLSTPTCAAVGVTMSHVISQSTMIQQSPRTRGSQIMENELFNLREELSQARAKLASWEDHWRQAKQVCDAWKREAEDANNRAALAHQERDQMRREQDQSGISNHLHTIAELTNLDKLPLSTLEKLHVQIKNDLDKLESVISHRHSTKCIKCQEYQRCVVTIPCKHCVLCEACAELLDEGSPCPHCNVVITSRSTVFLPL